LTAVIASLLILEGLLTGTRAAGRVSVLAVYPAVTMAFIAARFGVAVLQFAGGSMLLWKSPGGPVVAQWSLAASGLLLVFELGLGFSPTNLFPSYRWPAVAFYGAYALAGAAYLRWRFAAR